MTLCYVFFDRITRFSDIFNIPIGGFYNFISFLLRIDTPILAIHYIISIPNILFYQPVVLPFLPLQYILIY
jgi:hypothetical protein